MIINPMWIYLIEVLDNVYGLVDFVAFVSPCILGMMLLVNWFCYEGNVDPSWKTFQKRFAIAVLILNILNVLIPSQKTVYAMIGATYVTEENIEIAGDTVTGAIDYIFEKVDMLLEDNDV